MSCSCKHSKEAIEDGYKVLTEFAQLFMKRMTVDSETQDRRRRDYNQAIFDFNENGTTFQVWNEITLDMVMQCYADAMSDWRKTFCDTDNCREKKKAFIFITDRGKK